MSGEPYNDSTQITRKGNMEVTRLPKGTVYITYVCRVCGFENRCGTQIDSKYQEATPAKPDYTLCAICGHISKIVSRQPLVLREPDEADLADIEKNGKPLALLSRQLRTLFEAGVMRAVAQKVIAERASDTPPTIRG